MHAIPRTITLTLLLLATTIWGAAPAQAAKKTRSTTSDSTTTDSATTEVVSVNTVDLVVQAKKGYANSVKERILAVGGALKKDLPVINGAAYRVPADRVEEITNDAGVAFVSIDSKIRGTIFNATQAVGAYIAEQYGYTGKGIGVAVIDSGIDRHPDIRFKIGTDTDIIGSGTADDQYGHGTHVAGIIAGEYSGQDRHLLDSNVRYRGIAPGAKILSYKVLNAEGWGHESDVIDAIDQAIRMKDIYNIRVMNLSLGRPFYESYQVDPLCRAAQKAWDAGIVVVVAAGNLGRENSAGNEGYGTITAPANTPSVISVGVADAEPLYRLLTSLLDPAAAPAAELAALYHQRWEIETAFDELKTHLRGSKIVLRSKTPELVRQEFWGLLLAHFAIRDLMQQAAQKGGRDPDQLSYVHAVRLVRRKLAIAVAIPPSG